MWWSFSNVLLHPCRCRFELGNYISLMRSICSLCKSMPLIRLQKLVSVKKACQTLPFFLWRVMDDCSTWISKANALNCIKWWCVDMHHTWVCCIHIRILKSLFYTFLLHLLFFVFFFAQWIFSGSITSLSINMNCWSKVRYYMTWTQTNVFLDKLRGKEEKRGVVEGNEKVKEEVRRS